MNLKTLITAALVIGTTSAAMASPLRVQARSEVSWSSSALNVRDHRTDSRQLRATQTQILYGRRPVVVTSPLVTEDCSNWDPTVDTSNCGRELSVNTPIENPWTSLGSRDSSVADHQYITVEQQFHQLRLQSLTGAPVLDKVAIRYMDGSTQVVDVGTVRSCHDNIGGNVINLQRKEISQVVMYTAPGSRGTYSVYAA